MTVNRSSTSAICTAKPCCSGGDVDARIFCSRLDAELVSIAGRYLVSEQLPPEQQGFPVQIALVDERLTVTRN